MQDAAATWLLGHTEHITFGRPYILDHELLVDATVHVPCKYLKVEHDPRLAGNGTGRLARCTAHGYSGPPPRSSQPPAHQRPSMRPRPATFHLHYKGRPRTLPLRLKRSAPRSLPVLNGDNPCATAKCRTADNKQGAACCRDLTLDLALPKTAKRVESLLRARKSPYLCKVSRIDDDTMECEVISACGYLDPSDGLSCVLHDRVLPNGRIAKPSICREWPDLDEDEVAHPGCALVDE